MHIQGSLKLWLPQKYPNPLITSTALCGSNSHQLWWKESWAYESLYLDLSFRFRPQPWRGEQWEVWQIMFQDSTWLCDTLSKPLGMKKPQILGSEKPKCELGPICLPLPWAALHTRWVWYCFVDEDKYQHEHKVKKCIGLWKIKSQELNTHPPNKATDHPSLKPLLCGATESLNLSSLHTSLCREIFLVLQAKRCCLEFVVSQCSAQVPADQLITLRPISNFLEGRSLMVSLPWAHDLCQPMQRGSGNLLSEEWWFSLEI